MRTGTDGAAPAQTLLYSTGAVATDRIRYTQTAFDEYHAGDAAVLQEGALFYASTATRRLHHRGPAGRTRRPRLGRRQRERRDEPLANYPATNHPYDAWYTGLLTQAGAVS